MSFIDKMGRADLALSILSFIDEMERVKDKMERVRSSLFVLSFIDKMKRGGTLHLVLDE